MTADFDRESRATGWVSHVFDKQKESFLRAQKSRCKVRDDHGLNNELEHCMLVLHRNKDTIPHAVVDLECSQTRMHRLTAGWPRLADTKTCHNHRMWDVWRLSSSTPIFVCRSRKYWNTVHKNALMF